MGTRHIYCFFRYHERYIDSTENSENNLSSKGYGVIQRYDHPSNQLWVCSSDGIESYYIKILSDQQKRLAHINSSINRVDIFDHQIILKEWKREIYLKNNTHDMMLNKDRQPMNRL